MQFDAFERITQQQHRKLVSDFAWFYNIHWPQKNKNLQQKICLSGAFERNFGPESREYERTNLPKFKCAGGGGGGMMKPRIDLRVSKTIEMYETWLLH